MRHPDENQAAAERARQPDRGRRAETPSEVPAPGWLDIAWRTKSQLGEDNLSVVAAGVAFFGFLAVVPALAALIAIYALVADPAQIQQHIESLAQVMPGEVVPLLREQLTRIAQNSQAAGWSALIGIALAVLSSAKGSKAVMTGLNIAYDERERRSFIRLNAVALALTFFGVVAVLAIVLLVAVLPAVLSLVGLMQRSQQLVAWLRWPLVLVLFLGALAVLYRYGPCREAPRWRWVSWGAGIATLFWLVGSIGFSLYVSHFGSYDKTYGSLGAVVVFLMWLYLSAYAVLIGAELNSEMERQTARDTTTGQPEPLGRRDAYAADTVGRSRK